MNLPNSFLKEDILDGRQGDRFKLLCLLPCEVKVYSEDLCGRDHCTECARAAMAEPDYDKCPVCGALCPCMASKSLNDCKRGATLMTCSNHITGKYFVTGAIIKVEPDDVI